MSSRSDLGACLGEGWLCKIGGSVKTWKTRFFRLYSEQLFYYESETASQAKGSIALTGSRLSLYAADIFPSQPFCFGVTPQASGRHYILSASTAGDRLQWVCAMKPLCCRQLRASELSLKEGYLTKQGGTIKTWKRRWVVLTEAALIYYKDVKDVGREAARGGGDDGCGRLDLAGGLDAECEKGGKDGEWVFTVKPAVGNGRVFRFASQTEADRESWVRVLRQIRERQANQQMNISL